LVNELIRKWRELLRIAPSLVQFNLHIVIRAYHILSKGNTHACLHKLVTL